MKPARHILSESKPILASANPAAAPILLIAHVTSNATVWWSATSEEYELNYASTLAPSATWQSVTHGVALTGTNWMFHFAPSSNG